MGWFDTVPSGQARAMRAKGHLLIELHGDKLQGSWHLIRTRASVGKSPSWLFLESKDEFARPGYDVVGERPESVVSGKRVTRGPLRKKALLGRHPTPQTLASRVGESKRALVAISGDDVAIRDGGATTRRRSSPRFAMMRAASRSPRQC